MFNCKVIFLIAIVFITGCSADSELEGFSDSFELQQKKVGEDFLAEEHSLTIDLHESNIATTFQAVVARCNEDIDNQCTVLDSELNNGIYVYASIRVRVKPDGIDSLVSIATSSGQQTGLSTHVEDLAKPVIDNEERTGMLRAYMEDLVNLKEQSKGNVEALIKVTSEMAETQLKLDSMAGDHAYLRQRIDLDILNIRLVSERERSFSAPLKNAIADFADDLSEGIASAISGFAYLLPWLFILVPLAFLIRFLWRKFQ
jgi:VIT1/CCC1 family predicted Fe2+/Mn2+ transporter